MGLGFEGVCIERRDCVFDIQGRHPLRFPIHRRRGKAFTLPLIEVSIYSRGSTIKIAFGQKKLTIVFQPVHSNIKSPAAQLIQQISGNLPIALGNKIEARAKSKLLFYGS